MKFLLGVLFWFTRKLSKLNLDRTSIVIYDYTFGFTSHSKALYYFYKDTFPDRDILFVTNKPNVSLYSDIIIPRNSLKGIMALIFTKNFAITVGMPRYINLDNKNVIQFWHGTPIKSLGIYDNSLSEEEKKIRCQEFNNYSKVIVPNRLLEKSLIESFLISDKKKVIPISNPYLYEIYSSRLKHECHFNDSLNILYAPTFRNYENSRKWDLGENEEFAEFVSVEKLNIDIKYHPSDIKFDKNGIDLIDSISISDLLITDYSSVAFDAYDIGLNVVLFWPDLDTYENERGLCRDFELFYNFPIFYNVKDLIDYISNDVNDSFSKNSNIEECYNKMKNIVSDIYD